MQDLILRLGQLIEDADAEIMTYGMEELTHKIADDKWSKLEILGHLIDSAVNNLRRFTEIRFVDKPYVVTKYNQVELVKANDYQHAYVPDLLECWVGLNNQIIHVIGGLSPEELNYEVILDQGQKSDLRFVVKDYVDHMVHHLKQIGVLGDDF